MKRTDKEGLLMGLETQSIYTLNSEILTLRPAAGGVMDAIEAQIGKVIAARIAAGIVISGDTVNKEKA